MEKQYPLARTKPALQPLGIVSTEPPVHVGNKRTFLHTLLKNPVTVPIAVAGLRQNPPPPAPPAKPKKVAPFHKIDTNVGILYEQAWTKGEARAQVKARGLQLEPVQKKKAA